MNTLIDADFALYNVDQLVTVSPGIHPAAQGELGVINRAAIAAQDGMIVWVGPMEEIHDHVMVPTNATVINSHGRCVLPGFVDAHTHPIFAGDRSADFYARARGATYQEQVATGGMMQTVRATRSATEDELVALGLQRAEDFLLYGTTTIEGKSGYGLTGPDEQKSLRVLNRLQHLQPLKIVPAFLGAHVVPADFVGDSDSYVRELVESWLPEARTMAEICDVWCDPGAFSADQCRTILTRAGELGFTLTAHASELEAGPGVRLAVEMGCVSVDHAVYLTPGDIDALAQGSTTAVLLPGTTFFLGSDRYAPARLLIDAGARVALGTDFNPGTSYTQNMQFVLTLAVLKLGMSPEEAIQGATINGARAIGLEDRVGSIEPGKYCDFAIYRTSAYRQIPYRYAMNQVDTVVASGNVVVDGGIFVGDTPRQVEG